MLNVLNEGARLVAYIEMKWRGERLILAERSACRRRYRRLKNYDNVMMKSITYMHFKTGPWAHAGVLEHTHTYIHEHQDMRAEVAPAEMAHGQEW